MNNMSNMKKALLLCFVAAITACTPESEFGPLDGEAGPQEGENIQYEIISSDYINPVCPVDGPDPCVNRDADGMFYAYTTDAKIFKSEDLVNWIQLDGAFNGVVYPWWLNGGGFAAPCVHYINGKYVMYYSMMIWGGDIENGIGIAVSKTPEGPFSDLGKMFTSAEIGVLNSIDPCYYYHNDKHYLIWGSFHGGVWIAELTKNAYKINKDVPIVQLAGLIYEGTMIYERDGYFYLFCSKGDCCSGLNSNYQVVVGRSKNLYGPYVDKQGRSMVENHAELIMSSSEDFKGPGHHSELIVDDEGKTWIVYHAWNVNEPEAGRCLMLDEVKWDSEGWPYIDVPSRKLKKGPVFKKLKTDNDNE